LKILNKRQSKTNIEELTTLLDKYGIAYHALPIRLIQEKMPLKDILVENSTYQSSKLKKRLIERVSKRNIAKYADKVTHGMTNYLSCN
jgi:conserved domain protein